jgi:hypothetical protein
MELQATNASCFRRADWAAPTKHFPTPITTRRPHNAFRFHLFDHARRSRIADSQSALNQ